MNIPEMTDPLGRYWEQPSGLREAPMDEKTVLLTQVQFDQLLDYSTTMPSGVYPGKCWKRKERQRPWLLVWYGDETPDHQCPILFREIEVV